MIVLYLLYKQLGVAFLSGVIVSVLLIPVNKVITTNIGIHFYLIVPNNFLINYLIFLTGKFTEKLMNKKDKRVKLMSEIIKGIRVIKYHVWEKYFINKVSCKL